MDHQKLHTALHSYAKRNNAASKWISTIFVICIILTVIYVEELSVVFSVMALLLNLHGAILWGNTLSNTRKLNRAVSISNPSIIQLKDFLITEGNKPFINSWFYLNAFMLLGYSLSSVVLGYTTLTILLLVMAIFFFSITWILIASTIRHGTYDTFQIEHDDRN